MDKTVGTVVVLNCPKSADKFIVARAVMGDLWYWGSWDNRERAERVIKDEGFDNAVVIERTD